jgi:hypothetical protein
MELVAGITILAIPAAFWRWRHSRQEIMLAVAKWCCVWVEGDRARIAAKARAGEMRVILEGENG